MTISRFAIAGIVLAAAAGAAAQQKPPAARPATITVYKTPT